MNNKRRKQLEHIKDRIENLVSELVADIKEELESLRDEEQEAYDNLPESMQDGERGERMQEAADAIDETISELDNIDLGTITDGIERAVE